MTNTDKIYRLKQRLEKTIQRLKADSTLSKRDQEHLTRFVEWLQARNLSTSRIMRCLLYFRDLHQLLNGKEFEPATRNDIISAMAKADGKTWSPHTLQGLRVFTKLFYRWLESSETYPTKVSWIKTSIPKSKLKLPQTLSESEINAIVQACESERDKAFVLSLYEGGCRIGEFLPAQRKDIDFDQYGAVLHVHGKTGGRRVRLVQSVPLLSKWMECARDKNAEAYIWQKRNGKLMGAGLARKILKQAARRAGITKRVWLHGMRHSRASYLADKVPEPVLKELFGWEQSSKMVSVYVHMSGKQTDAAILKANGIQIDNGNITILAPRTCQRCQEKNSATAQYCLRCGSPMDITTLLKEEKQTVEMDSILTKLLSDPRAKQLLKEIMAQGEQGLTAK